jgi:hypothetical protein
MMRSPDILIFMRTASDIARCMYDAGLDPCAGQEVDVARHLKDRKLQRTLPQFFKPEIWFEVCQALLAAGRGDLIPANSPGAALKARMARSRRELTEGRYVHTIEAGDKPKPAQRGAAPAAGDWPHRKSTR